METICEETIKARNDHRCDFCGQTIKKGNKYSRQVNKECGEIYSLKRHLHCIEVASKLGMHEYCRQTGEEIDAEYFHNIVEGYLMKIYVSDWPSALKAVMENLGIKEDGRSINE